MSRDSSSFLSCERSKVQAISPKKDRKSSLACISRFLDKGAPFLKHFSPAAAAAGVCTGGLLRGGGCDSSGLQ